MFEDLSWILILRILVYLYLAYYLVCYLICSSFIRLDNSTLSKQWRNFRDSAFCLRYVLAAYCIWKALDVTLINTKNSITTIFAMVIYGDDLSDEELFKSLFWCVKPCKCGGIKMSMKTLEDKDGSITYRVKLFCEEDKSISTTSDNEFRSIAFLHAAILWNSYLKQNNLLK